MRNVSLPIFRLSGGPRLSIEPAGEPDRVRLVIHDSADGTWRGSDIMISMDEALASRLGEAVREFNGIMRLADLNNDRSAA